MQTFRIHTPAEIAAKKAAGAVQAEPQVSPQASQKNEPSFFLGYTDCADRLAVYHIPGGL